MYSKDLRKKVIDSYQTGSYSYRKLASKFEVSLKFVTQVLGNFKRTGEILKPKIIKPKRFKLTGIYEVYLIDLIKENPAITLNQISDHFKEHHNLSIGKSSVDRKLKSMKI